MLTSEFGWTPGLQFSQKVHERYVYVAWYREYFQTEPHMKFKIGLTANPNARMFSINPQMKLLFAHAWDVQTAKWMERALHNWFRHKRCDAPPGCQGKREWFALTAEDLGMIQYGMVMSGRKEGGLPQRLEKAW